MDRFHLGCLLLAHNLTAALLSSRHMRSRRSYWRLDNRVHEEGGVGHANFDLRQAPGRIAQVITTTVSGSIMQVSRTLYDRWRCRRTRKILTSWLQSPSLK